MKIEPVKKYKKPGYAMKIASIIAAAGSLAGCSTVGEVTVTTDTSKTTTEEVQLDGEIRIDETETTSQTTSATTQTTVKSTAKTTTNTTEPMLAGDVVIIDESKTTPSKTTGAYTSSQTKRTTTTTSEVELGGVLTTASTTEKLTTAGVPPVYTETTTEEVEIDGFMPVYTETTEVTLAGKPVLPME